MPDPFRCPQCGNLLGADLAKDKFDGSCPWCLARIAIDEPEASPPPLAPGVPFGRYFLGDRLGKGGMGEVWKARETQLDRWVALKFLRKEDPAELARFQREAQTAAGLTHPGIAAIYEVGEIDGRHYIAMQYVPGITMAVMPRDNRTLIVRLIRDAARAVDYAHRKGIIHRDVKPENLIVEETSEGPRVVVLDFGLARPLEGGEKLSRSGDVVGTAAYMSPEQAQGFKLDPRADLYSLGATLYELLAGRAPFEGDKLLEVIRKVCNDEPQRLRKIDPKIHRDLETIVSKCLEKDRDRRYASGRDLADDLDRFLNHEPIVARPPSTVYRLRMQLAKRKAVAAAVAAALLSLGTTAAIVVKGGSEAQALREEIERARPHLDAGRAVLNRMKNRMREAYTPEDLKALAAKARGHFERALTVAPRHAEAHLGIALAFALVGEKDRALEALNRAISSNPEFAPAYLERARLRLDEYEGMRHELWGELRAPSPEGITLREQLEFDLKRAELYSKEYPQQIYIRALLAFADGQHAKAAVDLAAYLEREPEDGPACNWLGHSLYHLNKHAEASLWLERGLAIDTRDHLSYNLRGSVRQAQGDLPGALADFERALEIKNDFQMAYYNRAFAKAARGDYAGAIPDYTQAIELKKGDAPMALFGRALARETQGDGAGALADYDRALKLRKDHVPLLVNRASLKQKLGDTAGALEDFSRAIEVKPDALHAISRRGVLRMDLGDLGGAIDDYNRAIAINENFADAYCNRGTARHLLDEIAAAIDDFDRAIRIRPGFGTAYLNRGVAKEDLGDFAGAINDFEKAIELKEQAELAYFDRGTVKRALGDMEAAVGDFRKAMDIAPPEWFFRPMAAQALADAEGMVASKDRREAFLRAMRRFVESNLLIFDKKHAEAAEGFRKIAEELSDSELGNLAAFQAGSLFALLGEKDQAFAWLEKAVDMGYRRLRKMQSLHRLAPIRSDERFRKLIEKIKAKR